MDYISKIIALSILSKYVKLYKEEGDTLTTYGVNLVLIAKPESGKTYNIFRFMKNKGVEIIQDINYEKLLDLIYGIVSRSRNTRTIIIPDFWKILAKKRSTVENFITTLNILVEEGILNIQAGKRFISVNYPIRINSILATTPAEFFLRRDIIGITGFISRFLPVSYSLSHEKILKIKHKIKGEERENNNLSPIQLNIPDSPIEIKIEDKYKDNIESLAMDVHNKIVTQLRLREEEAGYGFRLIRSMLKLAGANALLNNRTEVTEEDVEEIYKLADLFGFDFKSI